MGSSPMFDSTTVIETDVLAPPARFYQRFSPNGQMLNPHWARITTEESARGFEPRDNGLHLLLINAPIREWSYPNIMPLGHDEEDRTSARGFLLQ